MRVFVTGASGHVAASVVPELVRAGHDVVGLARSDGSADAVRLLGADVHRGDLQDLDGLRYAAGRADGVIHLAFRHDLMQSGNLAEAVDADQQAIAAMGEALAGTGKAFVGTNGALGLFLAGFRGELTEAVTLRRGPRIDAENMVIGFADQGIRSSVVRLPPVVHSDGRFGFVSGLLQMAAQAEVSRYPGSGRNRWPAVDTRDAAVLYRLALESATPGMRVHAAAETGIPVRDIAAAIGARIGVPVESSAEEQVEEHFGYLAPFITLDGPQVSALTRAGLGWNPFRPGLLRAINTATSPAAGADAALPEGGSPTPE